MSKTKILIIDDHQLLSDGLAMMLNAEKDLEVIGQASRPAAALNLAAAHQPDIILLDISLPEKNGLELLPEFRKVAPNTLVIMLTMHEEQQYLKKALEKGAKGFVLKKGGGTDLRYAIRAVMEGNTYIQPSMLNSLIHEGEKRKQRRQETEVGGPDEQLWQMLSQREQQVALGVAKGHTSREIAEKTFLSEKTVATYRSRAMAKLDMTTRADLVDFIIRLGKLDMSEPKS